MSQCIIGIDGGGTKTDARLVNLETGECRSLHGGPAHVNNDCSGAIAVVQGLVDGLLHSSGFERAQTTLVCGLAGISNKPEAARFRQAFEGQFRQFLLTSDAVTSTWGAGGGEPIVMVALGTGSVAMRLNPDGSSAQYGGWGFFIADEGGGAVMGRDAIRAALWEFDRCEGDTTKLGTMARALVAQIGSDRSDILQWLRNATPTKFASFAPLVVEHSAHSGSAKKIMDQAAQAVERKIAIARGNSDLPVALLGGLSPFLVPYLSDETQAILCSPKGSALDGCCLLARRLTTGKMATV
ncbi:BadF/BadG/BcrA/BcrD ATPase family protein [Biformimicrobium ophioploci]|uniref:BadF/BadG/BcrA/BcrD ATPase family protein n=1 Tax=Biformimicrobium ophioploci TaxID=3036711 RepID=A0ABQ6M0P3_9GAMM|nr:BadF/BadG/BcrA/BcrD ATPase family protein [Microbulbifer sp. NKW57]GMG87914.1 BadF/BadG/BcrA/BcrD ATPase family protein [Microbulbifer sp. NKW57]